MALKVPNSMNECLYFTNRWDVLAWVYRKECPKCHKAKMGKPVVKGKVKTRAKEYVCPNCGYTEDNETHESTLILEAKYTCPSCKKEGEYTGSYIRKNYLGIPPFIVECQHCGNKIPLTKKLKSKKSKDKIDDE